MTVRHAAPSAFFPATFSWAAFFWAAIILAACLLGACAADFDLAGPATIYVDEWVRRPSRPEIYVRPDNQPFAPMTAVLVPLRVAQPMDNRTDVSRGVTRILWQTWLADRVFPTLAFDEKSSWTGPDAALARHAASGADLIVGGVITNVMFGGTAGQTTISMNVEIYDARSGEMLWSMAHAGLMAPAQTHDFILAERVSRLPSDPLLAIVQVLARDMGKPIRLWNQPPLEDQEPGDAPEDGPRQGPWDEPKEIPGPRPVG